MKRRSKPALIRYHNFSIQRETESFYHSELYLYVPWRKEETLLSDSESYLESYYKHLPLISETKQSFQKHAELIEAVFEDFSEHGPQNNTWDLLDPVTQQIPAEEQAEGEELDPEYSFLDPGEINAKDPNTLPLPKLNQNKVTLDTISTIWTNEEYASHIRSLNFEQRQVFQIILDWCQSAVHCKRTGSIPPPLHLFVSGGAGTGKSHLIKAIYQMSLRTMRMATKTLLLAPTGTAAHNIEGNTIHAGLLIQIGQSRKHSSQVRLSDEKRNSIGNKLANLQVIIIDAISMMGADLLLQIHRRLDEIFQSKYDFGGVTILAFGDLHQLPPIGQPFVFQPPSDEYARLTGNLWENFQLFTLTQIMRQKKDASFAKMLNRIREAKFTEEDIHVLKSRLVENSKADYSSDTLHVYAWNEQVDSHNQQMLHQLHTEIFTIEANDKIPETLKGKTIPTDPRFTGGLPQTIHLAVGARVMLIRNINVTDGLTNGAQGSIVDFIFAFNKRPLVILIKFDMLEQKKQFSVDLICQNILLMLLQYPQQKQNFHYLNPSKMFS